MTMTERTTIKGTEARLVGESTEILRTMISEGDNIYSIVRWVNKIGDSRDISFFHAKDGQLTNITWHMARALRTKPRERNSRWVVRRNGGGMDMCFDFVHSLSLQLFGDGYKLKSETI